MTSSLSGWALVKSRWKEALGMFRKGRDQVKYQLINYVSSRLVCGTRFRESCSFLMRAIYMETYLIRESSTCSRTDVRASNLTTMSFNITVGLFIRVSH